MIATAPAGGVDPSALAIANTEKVITVLKNDYYIQAADTRKDPRIGWRGHLAEPRRTHRHERLDRGNFHARLLQPTTTPNGDHVYTLHAETRRNAIAAGVQMLARTAETLNSVGQCPRLLW